MQRLALAALAALAAFPCCAQTNSDTARLGGANGWDAFAYSEKGTKVCYLVGTPQTSEPKGLTRGRIDAYVTHRPGDKTLNVVHFDVGYALKPGSNAELQVDGRKFTLFTDKDAAWANDPAEDKAVTLALDHGKRAILKGSSARGANTADTYMLDGFKDALAAIDQACGVKR